MSFIKEKARIPSAIGELKIVLLDIPAIEVLGEERDARQQTVFNIQILDSQNSIMRTLKGNLVPHLTQTQINQLKAFINSIRLKAEQEIIGS